MKTKIVTNTRTFRVKSITLSRLEILANKKGKSVNQLVSETLDKLTALTK